MSENKKWYFVKLKDNFFSIDEIDYLLGLENGSEYLAIYLSLCLKTLNKNGQMTRTMGETIIPYDVKYIQRETKHFKPATIEKALDVYKKLGLIFEGDIKSNGLKQIMTVNMLGMEVGHDTSEAKRKREERKQKKESATSGQTSRQTADKCPDKRPPENRDKRIEYRNINSRDESRQNRKKKGSKHKNLFEKLPQDQQEELTRIINHLNESIGSNYRPNTKDTVIKFKNLKERDYKEEDFFKVIDNKVKDWANSEQSKYLRPETLFRESHFESYLNERVHVNKEKQKVDLYAGFESIK